MKKYPFLLRKIVLVSGLAALITGGGQLLAHPVTGAGERPTGAMLAHPCAGCHGPMGASAGETPILAGQPASYLYGSMLAYRDGQRHGTIMDRFAKGYSNAELQAISNFFAEQPWVSATRKTDPAAVARGRQLHGELGCIGCHGSHGQSTADGVPRLAGQYRYYLVAELENQRDPDRPLPAAALVMRSLLNQSPGGKLNDQQLHDLASFYATDSHQTNTREQ